MNGTPVSDSTTNETLQKQRGTRDGHGSLSKLKNAWEAYAAFLAAL